MKRIPNSRVKLLILPVLLVMLLLSSLLPARIQAQESINVISSRAEANFPDALKFSLDVTGAFPITKIYLRYRILNDNPIKVFSEVWMNFKPGSIVSTSWEWQMKKTGGLPPWTDMSYWWVITDERGNKVETTPKDFIYFDTRYSWQTKQRGNILLFWARGDDNFAEQLVTSATDSLARLEREAGIKLEKRVRLFVYPSSADLRAAILYATEWTGGVAFTDFGVVAIGISPAELGFGTRALAHELSHLVTRQSSFSFYGDIPVWLNEGLAMWNEGSMRPEMVLELQRAVEQRKFPTLRTLSSPFPGDVDEALLAYAESQSVVTFLLEKYGPNKMVELLQVFKNGSGYDEALLKVYGYDMDRLFELWRDSILSPQTLSRRSEGDMKYENILVGAWRAVPWRAVFKPAPAIIFQAT